MLDIKFIRDHADQLREVAKNKNVEVDLDELLKLDDKRRKFIQEIEELQQKKNANADKMKAIAKMNDDDKKTAIAEGKEIKVAIAKIEPKLRKVDESYNALMALVPNIPSDDTPVGKDEDSNVEVDKWGKLPKFGFEPKNHIELGESLNLLDTERGVKVAGFRGYYLKNELAMMHFGLMMYSLQKLQDKGFQVMTVPAMVRDLALVASGHFPGERDEVYEVTDHTGEGDKESKYLAGTSEPALLAYHANEILDEADLPVKLCAFSPCYRREVGSYGKDTRGVYRVHEFFKVEQVILCKNDTKEGLNLLEELKENSLEILRELELPHHIVQVCTGDMGTGKYKMFDIETWMPSRDAYSETHSDSYLTDWQARRANIRYRNKDGEVKYVHTLNNTAIASPRILIAILENHQQKDGSVKIPKVLQSYLGNKKVIKP